MKPTTSSYLFVKFSEHISYNGYIHLNSMNTMSVPISFRIDDYLAERLEKIAIKQHEKIGGKFNRSISLIQAIEEFCDRHENNEFIENNLVDTIEGIVQVRIQEFELMIDKRVQELVNRELNSAKNSKTSISSENIEYIENKLWTDAEVAEEENIGVSTVYRYRTGTRLTPKKFARRWKVSIENPKRWEAV